MHHISELKVSNVQSQLIIGFDKEPQLTELEGYSTISDLARDSILEVVLTKDIEALRHHITPELHDATIAWYHKNINNVENVRRD